MSAGLDRMWAGWRSVYVAAAGNGELVGEGSVFRRILESVDGVDIDPLTAVVARLRMTVYIGHLMARAGLIPAPLRLAAIPHSVTPRIAVGDALLLGVVSRAEYARAHPTLADLPGAAFPLPDFTWPDDPDHSSAATADDTQQPTADGSARHYQHTTTNRRNSP